MIAMKNFEIHSKNVLWYLNENNEPEMIPNIYDNSEVVRVYKGNLQTWIDYPIDGPLIYLPAISLVLFKTQNDAAAYMSIINSIEGCEILVENARRSGLTSAANREYSNWNIPNGIYCSKVLDSDLVDWGCLKEIRYLNEDNLIKKPKEIPSHLEKKISDYLTSFDDIPIKHDFENERILFEIYSENGKTYINHFFVKADPINFGGCFMYTRIMSYPLFKSKEDAAIWRWENEDGDSSPGKRLYYGQKRLETIKSVYDKEVARKQLFMKIAKMCGEFAYSHLQDIIDFGKNKIFKKK